MKANLKEPENPGVHYFAAQLYFTETYSRYDLDTARLAINSAHEFYSQQTEENREDLAEDGVTIGALEELSTKIRDQLYENVQLGLTIESAEKFMRHYPGSPYESSLTFQRDSLVFSKVKLETSPEAYESFLANYPNSSFADPAAEKLDELNYKKLRETGSLQQNYQFLKEHPATRFRKQVEEFILMNSTADHQPESYLDFMDLAKSTDLRKRAADVLFYIDEKYAYNHPRTDSLREVQRSRNRLLVPTIDRGKFGFVSVSGESQISNQFEDVDYNVKCEITSDEWIFVTKDRSGQIVNKQGLVLVNDVEGYVDLGSGVAKVEIEGAWYVYHKSGFRIIDEPLEDAEVMAGRWIKVKKDDKWGLISFLGYRILGYEYQNINIEGVFWVFERDDLLALTKEGVIVKAINDNGLDLEFKFEDLEFLGDKVIGFRDTRECMFDEDLNFLIPWGTYEINPDESGWYLKTQNGYRLYNNERQDIMDEIHPYLETNMGWLALQTDQDWMLLPRQIDVLPSRGYDSLKLLNDFCVYAIRDETNTLLFTNGVSYPINEEQSIRTFTSHEEFLLVEEGTQKTILGKAGDEIITGVFDEISFFNDSLIQVDIKGKHGLLHIDGKYLLEPKYDALSEEDGLVLCLEKGKIGSLDLRSSTWIPTEYEARIERIGLNYQVKKGGKYGVIDAQLQSILPYEFDEVKFWNDTSFLAKAGSLWNFVTLEGEKTPDSFEFMTELLGGDESVWKFVSKGKYGLVSSQKGLLLRPEFTDIFNVGTSETPVFFADQHLDKAGFHVVSYVDRNGELILSKAYRDTEFERILCDD